jgi:hypothetical protein
MDAPVIGFTLRLQSMARLPAQPLQVRIIVRAGLRQWDSVVDFALVLVYGAPTDLAGVPIAPSDAGVAGLQRAASQPQMRRRAERWTPDVVDHLRDRRKPHVSNRREQALQSLHRMIGVPSRYIDAASSS